MIFGSLAITWGVFLAIKSLAWLEFVSSNERKVFSWVLSGWLKLSWRSFKFVDWGAAGPVSSLKVYECNNHICVMQMILSL